MSVSDSHISPAVNPPTLQTVADQGNNPPSSKNQPPKLKNRTVGDHAKSFGYDWKNRADHHKYVLKTGLPEVHAAILNEDWDYAGEILCAEDIGLQWLPPVSQRNSPSGFNTTDGFSWPVALPGTDQDKQNRAIVEMAIEFAGTTSVAGAGCLYGANLLTLCLQLPAPADFTQRVVDMAKRHAPVYLSLPDASGRTPLYIAIERQDADQIRALLDAGADPFIQCRIGQGETPSTYQIAMKKEYENPFSILLEKMIPRFTPDGKYSVLNDDLSLKQWVAQHDEVAVRKLADQFPVLRDALFNYVDKSGTSLVYRNLKQGAVEELVDVAMVPLIYQDLESNVLYAAAFGAPINTFSELLSSTLSQYDITERIYIDLNQVLNFFFMKRSTADIKALLEIPGEIGRETRTRLIELMKYGAIYSTEKFISLAKFLWPTLDDIEKNDLFVATTRYPEACFNAVLDILDCSLTEKHIASMLTKASTDKHKTAWEFAADRSPYMGYLLKKISEKNHQLFEYIQQAVNVGSLRWFDTFMDAGFDLQKNIKLNARAFLPGLADLDPSGLQKRLAGYQLPIDTTIPALCKTEQGKLALSGLMKASLSLQ